MYLTTLREVESVIIGDNVKYTVQIVLEIIGKDCQQGKILRAQQLPAVLGQL